MKITVEMPGYKSQVVELEKEPETKYVGNWYLLPLSKKVVECIGYDPARPVWHMRFDYRPEYVEHWTALMGSCDYPVPPKPAAPDGYQLTGRIVDISTCSESTSWLSDTGHSVFTGRADRWNDRYGPRRWEVKRTRPEPKYKRGDWFYCGNAFARLDSDAQWLEGRGVWRYDWTFMQGDHQDTWRIADGRSGIEEFCLGDTKGWLPIPPRPELPEGWEFTGDVRVPKLDENFCGGPHNPCGIRIRKERGVLSEPVAGEGLPGRWLDESDAFFGGRRWIVRQVKPQVPDRKGEWYRHKSQTDLINEIIGKAKNGNHAYRSYIGTRLERTVDESSDSGWMEDALSNFDRIPPMPTNLPDGKRLTGEVRVPERGTSYAIPCATNKRGENLIIAQSDGSVSRFEYAGLRWIVTDDRPEPRYGFRVWEPGMKDDGRVMLRLVDNQDDSVSVHAVDEAGVTVCAGRIACFTREGYLRPTGAIDPKLKVQHSCGHIAVER